MTFCPFYCHAHLKGHGWHTHPMCVPGSNLSSMRSFSPIDEAVWAPAGNKQTNAPIPVGVSLGMGSDLTQSVPPKSSGSPVIFISCPSLKTTCLCIFMPHPLEGRVGSQSHSPSPPPYKFQPIWSNSLSAYR